MATVYLAGDLKHHRKVALKVLKPDLAATLGPERFLREIEIAAQLTHPHILPLHDSGEARGFLYYVMPYVEGESLRERLSRERQLSLEDAIQVAREVADALSSAHSRGVVHRDIKPENILLQEGHAVVTDFGIARALSAAGGENLTETGMTVGTPAYMSPEQAAGQEGIDGRSDIYSLGCVLYEMLGGDPPYTASTPQAILARKVADPVPSLRVVRDTVPEALEQTVTRALAKVPADRFATAGQLAESLGRVVSGEVPVQTVPKAHSARPTLRWKRGYAIPIVVFAAIVVVLLSRMASSASASLEPATLVVFPFRSTADDNSIGEGIADLLAASLDGTVGIRVADPVAMWRSLRRGSDQSLHVPELSEALELAQQAGTPRVVLGSVSEVGGRMEVSARVYDLDGQLRTTLRNSVPAGSLSVAVDRLAIDVVSSVWERDTLPGVPVVESFATGSIGALKAYLEAKSWVYRGFYDAAEEAIEQAVTLDSTFALAHLEQHKIRSWQLFQSGLPFTGLTEIIDRAMQYRDRLSPRYRLRVEAEKALSRTDGVRAATLLGRILEIDSLDLDALQTLANVYLDHGWQLDKTADDVAALCQRVLELDPASTSAYSMLLSVSPWSENSDSLQQHLAGLTSVDTLNPVVSGSLGAVRALTSSGAAQDSILRVLAGQSMPVVTRVLRDLRAREPEVAERFLAELMADTMPVYHQRIGQGARTQLWFGEGRLAANDSLVRAGFLAPIRPTVNRFFVAASMAGVGDSSATARAVAELAAYAPADSLDDYLDSKQMVWAAGWAVGAYHAVLGDTLEARRWQSAIAQLAPSDTSRDWPGALAADIEARIAVRSGDAETAERNARRAYDTWGDHSSNVLDSHPEPAMRFHLAEILRSRGLLNESRRLFHSFVPPGNWAAYYTARSSWELGVLAEEEGDLREAVLQYGAALGLWSRGEAAVAEWRLLAESALQRVLREIG
jgi:tetratricopeptide (TPR) repeat protein